MKKILNIIAVGVFLFLSACTEDFLDTNALGEQTAGSFYATEEELMQATTACYSPLQHYIYNWSRTDLASYTTDDAVRREQNYSLDSYGFDANGLLFSRNYRYNYRGILICNNLIYNVEGKDKPLVKDKAFLTRAVGEAKFMRAFYYFDLVRNYGDVPLVKQPLTPDELNMMRTDADEVYAFIEKNLREAADALPKKSEYSPADYGRATKGAALALLTKVQVWQASEGYSTESFYDESKWAAAKTTAEELFALNEYQLYTGDYHDIFTQAGENGVGSIFEVQFYDDPTNGGAYTDNGNFNTFLNLPWWGGNDPYGEYQCTYDLYAAFESDDPRREKSVISSLQWAALWGNDWDGGKTQIDPTGDKTGLCDYKHYISKEDYVALGNFRNSPINERVLRLSDIYLLYAEACYHTGDEAKAQQYINMVRERARQGNSSVLADVTVSGPALLAAIYRERRIELCNEGHRWYDLVRWGLLEKEIKTDGYKLRANVVDNGDGTYTVTDAGEPAFKATALTMPKHLYFPLPQTEIDNSNGAIVQNPGY